MYTVLTLSNTIGNSDWISTVYNNIPGNLTQEVPQRCLYSSGDA